MSTRIGKTLNYDFVIYHDFCSDGTACLWIIEDFCNSKTTYIPIGSGQINRLTDENIIEKFSGKNVIFADIIPTKEQFNILKKNCHFVTIIDHHLSSLNVFEDYVDQDYNSVNYVGPHHNVFIDMNKSACQMVWDYFYHDVERPWAIDYIGDRDLYKFELPNSKEINLAMFKLRLINPTGLTQLTNYSDADKCELIEKGTVYLTEENLQCMKWGKNAKYCKFYVNDQIYDIWSLSCPSALRSCVGNFMCGTKLPNENNPDFTIIWRLSTDKSEYWISLRGNGKHDLDAIAKQLDSTGGGHYDASGLTLSVADFESLVIKV
jgi:uncharacterized protein